MRVVDQFPREVVEEARLRIPMSDGVHLAGRLWRPADSDERPCRRSSSTSRTGSAT